MTTTKTATKTQEVETVVYEAPEGQPVVVDAKRSRFVKKETEEKPKGRVRKWFSGKLNQAADFLSDDEKFRSFEKGVKRGAIIGGVGLLGLTVAGAVMGSKSDSDESLDGCDVDQDHYLETGDSDNDGDYYVEESVEEVTEEI